jgi:hypothetical protein
MGEELAVINPAVTGCGEGGMAELSRALNAGSIVGQLTMARRWGWLGAAACMANEAALGRLQEEGGVPPPPPPPDPHPGWAKWAMGPMAS